MKAIDFAINRMFSYTYRLLDMFWMAKASKFFLCSLLWVRGGRILPQQILKLESVHRVDLKV